MSVNTLDELIAELRARGLHEVLVTSKVATYTRPKGEEITFRGRLVVRADAPGRQRLEYVEQVPAYVTAPGSPEVTLSEEARGELKEAQMALLRQLRAYRARYQGVMESARASLTQRLAAAGIAIAAAEGE
jgi:hypothetical protein